MAALIDKLRGFIEDSLESESHFLVDINLSGGSQVSRLQVLIDGDQGVTIDACARLSRALSKRLDDEDLIDNKYHLEVSSAGADFPLKLIRQYKKNVGRKVKVRTKDSNNVEGLLIEASEDHIMIEENVRKNKNTEKVRVPFDNIEQTKVIVSFN